jgi:uncharacterized membrane protein YfcA
MELARMDLVSAGLPLIGMWQFVFLGVIAFLGAVVGGLSSFGAGLLVTPFLVPIVGIKGVVPVMAVAMTFGNLSRIWVYRHEIQARPIFQILVPAMPGVVLGAFLNDLLPRAALGLALGLFLIASIPLRRYLARHRIIPTPRAIIGGSLAFGLISGAMPGGGVVVLPLLLGIGLKGGGLVGTDAAIGVCVNIAKVILFGAFSLLDGELVVGGLLIGLCMIPGAYAARWLLQRINLTAHTVLVELLVLFSGASFIWAAMFP